MSIHEPHLLSSYTSPSRSFARDSFLLDITGTEYDYKGYTTITVQGDGVHVFEMSEMQPVISHTLGPDTRFICPAVIQVDGSGTLSTFALTAQPNTGNGGSNYCLRKWTDSLLDNSRRFPEQQSSPDLIENIHRIYTPPKLPTKLVALSVSGHIYVLSTETLSIDQFIRHTTGNCTLFRSFAFSPESCSFASQHLNSNGTLIVRFLFVDKSLVVNLCLLSTSGVKEITSRRLCDSEGIVDLTCSSSGYIMVLTSLGTWRIFRLDEQGQLMKEITFTHHSHIKSAIPKYYGFAVTSIFSSFALLACIEGSSNLHFTLFDLRFSVVLATQTFALPSNLTTGPKASLQIKLAPARRTEVIVLVSPSKGSETTSSSRSAIFNLPVTIPTSSSIALAMGKASEIPVWLPNIKAPLLREEGARQGLLHRIKAAVDKGLPHEADAIFFAWVEESSARSKRQENAMDDRPDVADKFGRGAGSKFPKKPKPPKLSYRFVADLLDIVLQPTKASNVPYSSKIPAYLIERKAIGDNMIQGGFVSALRRKGDWKSICATLQSMGDIPEAEIVTLLSEVLANHRRNSGTITDRDAMDIEPTDGSIPSLASFLPLVIRYQSTYTAACYALKTTFSNVNDVILILEELDQMLETVCKRDLLTSPVDSPSLPSLQSILSFMQYILDAHFLTLLQDPSARPLLKQISSHLQEDIFTLQEFDQLREPLNTIFQTQGSPRNMGPRENKKDRRKDSLSAFIGLYQVEELVL